MTTTSLLRRPLALLLLLGLCFGGPIPMDLLSTTEAAPSKDKRRIKALTKQNRSLKRTVATLRGQLVAARRPIPLPAPFMEMVRVGNAGNAPDQDFGDGQFGAVPYEFQIGKYEVTLAQYTAFLNAVAVTEDTYNLYSTGMATNAVIAGIARTGNSPNFAYSVIGTGNRPVTHVNWFDAARFCNWLHNGRPAGAQDATTTERGAYTLDGAISGLGFERVWGAKYWIPSEDEWYKAAYHQPSGEGGDVDDYWLFPTRSNSVPVNSAGPSPFANRANFFTTVYAVTQSGSYNSNQNYLTTVGSYSGSASFYGTFDQGGNVIEWNDSVIEVSRRGLRGGSWFGADDALQSSARRRTEPENQTNSTGFRVASP